MDRKCAHGRIRPGAGRRFSRTLIASLLLMVALLAAAGAGAAYTVDNHDEPVTGKLNVSPAKVELELDDGSSALRDITVTNQTGETVTLMFRIENFQGSEDPTEAFILTGDEDDGRGGREWLGTELDSIVLKQDESITFRIDISVPEDTLPGGYYAALVATITDGYEEELMTTDEEMPVSLFLIRVPGNIYEEGDIEDIRISPVSTRGPVDIGVLFGNLSDAHVQPEGRVRITNLFGQQVAEIPIERWVVMPDSTREKLVQWQNPSLFGRFKAEVELDFGPDDQRIIASKTFWVISWPVVVVLLIVVAAIIGMIVMLARRRGGGAASEKTAKLAEVSAETAGEAAESAAESGTHIPLNRLFPSMEESRLVDITDPETRKLCASLISGQIDLAQAYISEGRGDRARRELKEAREAAQSLGMLSEIGIIDTMLSEL